MPPQKLTPGTWTFRLKHHMTTVLLFVDPLRNLSSVKAELLKALQETTPTKELNGTPLPEDPEQFKLARLKDINDPLSGWIALDLSPLDDDEAGGKRKGKVVNGQSVKALGLQDGAILAFRWGDDETPAMDDEGMDIQEEKWDVVMPSGEDADIEEDLGGPDGRP